ncbi:iron chelate uptake ABC transporter family permease subunit [Corynebacterium rhinophilum]|uniref:iron chelate uptake ABC transporter family permease subunit n=1 Tax=Corynebacterium rhinophilum TaxID=3050197 RepID=UPI002549C9CC|nr:iron chelate uptake ABC transporter family permease subunit [Corynebacterium sp. MSK156]MDK8787467.1 iron chelate uptake ABC transporter family permease subunit [Corynebacterium sp. MSK156]
MLDVNAGAGFAVTLGVGFFGLSSVTGYIWFAFLDAAATTVFVYLEGAASGGTVHPATLVLAGVTLGAVLTGLTSFLTLIDPTTFDAVRHWGVGSTASVTFGDIRSVLPFLTVGMALPITLLAVPLEFTQDS